MNDIFFYQMLYWLIAIAAACAIFISRMANPSSGFTFVNVDTNNGDVSPSMTFDDTGVISRISNSRVVQRFDKISGSSRITVNGKEYTFEGARQVSVMNNRIYVDGKLIDNDFPSDKRLEVHVHITGNVEGGVVTELGNVEVKGEVRGGVKAGGDVTCGAVVSGSVDTRSGRVTVNGNVAEGVKTMSGDVKVTGDVGGAVSTMSGSVTTGGDIKGKVSSMSGSVYTQKAGSPKRGRAEF